MSKRSGSFTAVVDRFEGTTAVIVFEDETEAILPISKLPINIHEGDVLVINVQNGLISSARARQKVVDIINELTISEQP